MKRRIKGEEDGNTVPINIDTEKKVKPRNGNRGL
jgi:hypothetical protein